MWSCYDESALDRLCVRRNLESAPGCSSVCGRGPADGVNVISEPADANGA